MGFLSISKFLLILIIPLLLFIFVLNFYGFDSTFYQEKFREYQVQKNTSEAIYIHETLINFIRGKNNQIPDEFNERERQHLWDVRSIVKISTILLYIFIILFVILLLASAFILKINNLVTNFVGKVLVFGGFLTIALAAILFLFISSDFSATFESFHRILFEKGSYIFDPKKDLIVNLYPEQLFMELGAKISRGVLVTSIIIIIIGLILIFKSKSKKNKK